jgi:eukaryotic-like serine/threonine-protein kinase
MLSSYEGDQTCYDGDMEDPLIGKVVDNGEFQIVEKLGAGGMGAVYKARQPSMNRLVAIKVLHAKYLSRDDLVSRFRREARSMSQLTHPNTAHVYKYGQLDDGSCYFVMDYLDGHTIAQEVRRNGPLDPDRAIYIMAQVCGALQEAHQAGIIHRDMKPENIFLTKQAGTADFPKVLDFGLAKVTEKQMGTRSIMHLTQHGTIFGTPEFMSPEQALGAPLDQRSDIYALGLILYEMLTGKLPFDVTGKREIMTAQVKTPPIPLSKRRPGKSFSPDLDAVIAKAIAKNPADRFQSAAHFCEALLGCLSEGYLPSGLHSLPRVSSESISARGTDSDEYDRPQLPVTKTPIYMLIGGIALAIFGIVALVVSILR